MATVGLKDLFYAPITFTSDGNGGETETYGTPVRLAKAITAGLSLEIAEAVLYADDGAAEVERAFVSGELTLGVDDITPEISSVLLGSKLSGADAIKKETSNIGDTAPYVAIGFSARKPRGKYKYVWLYKVKFGIPDETYETQNDSINFVTPELVGKIVARSNGDWKINAVAKPDDEVATGWFTAVQEADAA
jgi:phi13 family phage major tail protein